MKRIAAAFVCILLISSLAGCAPEPPAQVVTTTAPVYQFTTALCQGTDIAVTQLITENVSCLHDYSLSVRQVRAVEGAQLCIISGAGLEAFMEDLHPTQTVDSSSGIHLLGCESDHDHDHDHHGHTHEQDSHIWLSPLHAKEMASNICAGLSSQYPQYRKIFQSNLRQLHQRLDDLYAYGLAQLSTLSCREMITFHDGFSYLAHVFDLTILEAVEEESGSEASAQELIHLITLVRNHQLPAIFTEVNGSTSAAAIIAAETGVPSLPLDMAMAGSDYFEAMYYNIDTIKEALG